MPSPPRTGPLWRERGVLALGLASSVVLGVAAFLRSNDPETAGRTALAQITARTEQAVVAEWERMLRDPAPIAPAASGWFGGTEWKSPRPDRPVEPSDPAIGRHPDDPACAALLEEAERIEFAEGDAHGALDLVAEAMTKKPSFRQRIAGGLALIQLASKLGEKDRAAHGFEELLALAQEPAALDATSTMLLVRAVLAAEPLVEGGVRCLEPTEDVLLRWCDFADREPAPRIERIGTERAWYAVVGNEPLEALSARLNELTPCPRHDRNSSLAVDARMADAPRRAALRALETFLGAWPDDPGGDDWVLIPAGDDLFARRWNLSGSWDGFFVARVDLGVQLIERLRTEELLPEGVAVDFAGTDESLGKALDERVPLAGPTLGFVLRHRDPEALVRGVSRRQGWMRVALLVMAAAAAGAGVLMARALRRERRLAELKATFIANVSHELRTPLASILLMAENLEAGRAKEPATQAKYHGLIRREAIRLARLVDDVLDFSRLERGKGLEVRREEVVPAAVVDDWCSDARAWAAQHGLELATDVRALPERAVLDRDALRRALFNLLDNARKHSGSKSVTLGASGEDGALVLRVADAGRGIPLGRRASVFEPFERDEGAGRAPGAGLGLAIVREIVRAHGGTIAIRDPESGTGTVFEVRLPIAREEERA